MAFCSCGRLRRAALNEGLARLGTDVRAGGKRCPGVFEGSGLVEVRLPATLRRVEYAAFRDCARPRAVALPAGLETLGEWCFADSWLEKITIPASVREVGAGAFAGTAVALLALPAAARVAGPAGPACVVGRTRVVTLRWSWASLPVAAAGCAQGRPGLLLLLAALLALAALGSLPRGAGHAAAS